MKCSCRRADLDCSPGCGECQGVCANMTASSDEAEFTEDEQTFGL